MWRLYRMYDQKVKAPWDLLLPLGVFGSCFASISFAGKIHPIFTAAGLFVLGLLGISRIIYVDLVSNH